MEVEASDNGVGAVLSQWNLFEQKLYVCSVLGWQFVLLEVNYDVVNRELIAVVLTQKKWRQCLEESNRVFIVWTDHKHL